MLTLFPALLVGGLFAGLIAGLFGVGGGTVSVPVLVALFTFLGYSDDIILKLAIGTSLAVLTPTTTLSFIGHWRKGAVQLDLLRKLLLPLLGGVLLGSWLASFLAPVYLKTVFTLITILFGLKFLIGYDIKGKTREAPAPLQRSKAILTGTSIGTLSVLMGIGGGLFGNMLFTLMGYDIRRSVATSSGLGIIIGIAGVIGFIWAGADQTNLPPWSLGYVSLIGAALMIPASALTVPLGVKLAHSIQPRRLEQIFGAYLVCVGLYILF